MSDIQTLLAVLGALWVSYHSTNSVMIQINTKRDQILTGKIGATQISAKHREIIFERDWKPLYLGLVARSLVFLVILALLPFLAETHKPVHILACVVAAVIPVLSIADYFVSGRKDKSDLQRTVKSALESQMNDTDQLGS